jgi:hypothetical protein
MNPRFALVSLALFVLSAPIGAHATWQVNGVPISTAASFQAMPRIASDGSAGAIMTWMDGRNGGYDVYTQRVNAAGVVQWTTDGVALGTGVGDQQVPAIVSDGSGGAIVAWQDSRSGNFDIYVQRIDASGTVQWTGNGVAICTAAADQLNTTIASDGSGGAVVTWYDHRSGADDIYAQRINASGAVQWTANGVALCAATGDQRFPVIVSDGSGGAVVTWQDSRGGTNWDMYAQRINASGVVQWTADGVALCTAAGNQEIFTITADGSGGAMVTWQDSRGADIDIYAQRINTSGVVQWTINGVGLCTAAGTQGNPTISSDGSGGAIVAWNDGRSGTADIYAQRVDASGVMQWTADGLALCAAAGTQQNPTISSDGSGGAIVAWSDSRPGAADIYAQRVNASGLVSWTADGVRLCIAANPQIFPAIVSDGSAGAVVTWMDIRSGLPDVYAQRIGSSGSIPTSVDETPSFARMSLSANSPNPFTNETMIDLNLAAGADVDVAVYDVAGREVRRMGRSYESAGVHPMSFDGRDDKGRPLASGMYFYKVTADASSPESRVIVGSGQC